MLTEVSEQDLLNLINENAGVAIIFSEEGLVNIYNQVKIHKPKQNMTYDEEVDKVDYIDEEAYVENEEIS